MTTDVLVLGTGIAGLFFALRAAQDAEVLILTKKDRPESNTNYAQGGIAAVFGADDSSDAHVADTLLAGAGLCHPDAVRVLVTEGPARVRELMELGVRFSRERGELSLGREGGHSRRRIVRADDLTGREIERALLAAAADHPRIRLLENQAALDLWMADGVSNQPLRCGGVIALNTDTGEVTEVAAGAVVLATGGCGQVYRHTTNPAIATGDGVAMAYRAGAAIANMEFVQFHPTALYPASDSSFLISEAVRGEGATLVRLDGESFMERYHPLQSLAPRDVVARAIDAEMKRSGDTHVLLDCSAIRPSEIRARFPNILRETAARGIDMLREPLPVVPAAHYLCGGVFTDLDGRTSTLGLYAIGETACTGVHGANRLASNSLLEALVFAHRAAERLRTEFRPAASCAVAAGWPDSAAAPNAATIAIEKHQLRSLMWELVGIVRSRERLEAAEASVRDAVARCAERWRTQAPSVEAAELRNLCDVALLIVRSARARRESRGLHHVPDYPYKDNERFLQNTVLHA